MSETKIQDKIDYKEDIKSSSDFQFMTPENLIKHLGHRFDIGDLNIVTKGYGQWTTRIKFNKFEFSEILSGCGALVFSGYANIYPISNKDKYIPVLTYLFDLYGKLGMAGTFITTNSPNSSQSFLEALGFKEIITYDNRRHPMNDNKKWDQQKLMIRLYND